MLMGLALAAFQPEMSAQPRSGSRSSSTSRPTSSDRSSGHSARPASRPSAKPDNRPKPNGPKPGYRPGTPDRPIGVRPPSSRLPQPHRPPVYRPARPKRPYVRPIVIRPAYGSVIAAEIAAGMTWAAVNMAYFNTVARTYDQISDNSETIAMQNEIIAQNNATIAAQNQAIAQSQTRAQQAYGLANSLGLVQSYADAGASYFYQDGVFYIQGTDGQYYVIVPPAGALVENLPEDFETVVINGNTYYKVDNTIYQMTIVDGKPYFEVVGQMN